MLLGTHMLEFRCRKTAYWGLCFTAAEPNVVVNMAKTGSPPSVALEYSTDGRKWLPFDADNGTTPITLKKAGSLVYFRAGSGGNAAMASYITSKRTFTCSGYCAASGNIMSLLDAEDESAISITSQYSFCQLFSGNTKITSAPVLPAETLADYCYAYMFNGCAALMTAPALPATTLAGPCYYQMFNGCTSLTTAPTLPATTLTNSCYFLMFCDCTSLVHAPALPATTLTNSCYRQMFQGCTGLTTAPDLPATSSNGNYVYASMFRGCTSLVVAPDVNLSTIPEHGCESMFSGCTSLTTMGSLSNVQAVQTSGCSFMYDGCTALVNTYSLPPVANFSYMYEYMFRGCTSLVTPPALPATWVGQNDYIGMFYGCTSLTTAPTLPATTLAYGNCYDSMFYGCTSLTTAPALPATSLSDYCYRRMFDGCSSLTSAPTLPATTLKQRCYYQMFHGCSSLTSAPALPATTLANNCYYGMFSDCTSLISAPTLPATTLAIECYYQMFSGCSSLATVPALPALVCGSNSCAYMFNGCSALASLSIKLLSFDGCSNWLNGVAANGSFTCPELLGTNETITRGVSACPSGWTVTGVPCEDPLTFTAETAGSTISMAKNGSPTVTPDLVYRTYNGSAWGSWSTFIPGTTSVTLANVGDKMQLYGADANTATASSYSTNYWHFNLSGSLAASGSMTSIVRAESAANYTFAGLFRGCTALTSAPYLPATALTSTYCYAYMFYGCTSLTTAPELPAETLANSCYISMFYGCTSLTTAPELPAETLANSCYNSMFYGCTSLTAAPELPATTLAASCYQSMFNGCTALTTAPDLPATTLTASCYRQMFYGCTSLTTAPDLPATTANASMYVYYRMFYNCTGLERTGRIAIATATGINALGQMFYGCSNLKYIELSGMTAWSTRMSNWVNGVSANGLFVCPSALGTESTITRGTANCPTGWTVANSDMFLRSTGTYLVGTEQGSNGSCINTGKAPSPSLKIEITCRVTPGSTFQHWPYLLGSQNSNDNANTYSLRGSAGEGPPWINYRWGHTGWHNILPAEAVSTWGVSTEWHSITVGRDALVVDGTAYDPSSFSTNSNANTYPVYIGAINRAGTARNCIPLDISRIKIWQSNELVADLHPVESGGVCGVIDSVGGQFTSSATSYAYTIQQMS